MRRVLLAAYAVYLLTAAYLVFWPQPDTPAGVVADIAESLASIGISWISSAMIEFLLNVVLFVPLTLLGVLLWPRWSLLLWVILGIGGTVLIESLQYAALPDRSAAVKDIVSNSLGPQIGVGLGRGRH
ncbi:MAG: VanZ family protein, partial [Nocardioides sp.]|nr:VanZ family protein [Nocardioides sp.]